MRSIADWRYLSFFMLLAILAMSSLAAERVFGQGSTDGEALFNEKCVICHSVGGGKGIGPDLDGVVDKRDRAWLVRMLVEPENLHSEGDLVALELQAEYGMPMPGTGIDEAQANAILDFLGGATEEPDSAGAAETEIDDAGEVPTVTEPALQSSGDPVLDMGEKLYLQTCDPCHSIGGGRTIGVDLAGITRVRDREWLIKVLLDPPAYQMPMPQFGLDEEEIIAILTYIETHQATPEGGFGASIGKPVPETVAGEGEIGAVLDYIFGEDRVDQPKTAALSEPTTWSNIPPIARFLVIAGAALFVIFLLAIMLEATFRKQPRET